MSKRGSLTQTSVKHGDQNDPLHGVHKNQGDIRREKGKKSIFVRHEVAEEADYPPFKSDISKLGGGQTFEVVRKAGIIEVGTLDAKEWKKQLAAAEAEFSWFHDLQNRKGKEGYYQRKIKDRDKRGPTDTHGRKSTDVMRETIDLRPDHSRVVQYLLEAGRQKEIASVLAEIRVKKIELFEAIYGRTVLFDGEHDDSGQHHDDLWHAGISACPTEMVVNKKTGEAVPRRDRIPFRAYGVGVGAASWWRHFEALKETGMTEEDLNSLAGGTLLALEEDKTKAKGQNEEEPRDLRLLAELDAFVVEKLQALDVPLYLKARSEYSEWVRKGYETGKLGVKRGRALEKLSGKVKELEGELMELRGLKKLVKELVEAVQKSKLMGQLLKISAPAGKLLEKLAKAVGISLKGPKIMKGESPVGIGT